LIQNLIFTLIEALIFTKIFFTTLNTRSKMKLVSVGRTILKWRLVE